MLSRVDRDTFQTETYSTCITDQLPFADKLSTSSKQGQATDKSFHLTIYTGDVSQRSYFSIHNLISLKKHLELISPPIPGGLPQYDEVYDDMADRKAQEKAAKTVEKVDRKPKYIANLLKQVSQNGYMARS